MSKSRTGLADSQRRWATRSAMDDNGVPRLRSTLSAIDSDGLVVGCFRMGFGDITINWGGAGSSLPSILICTLGGASTCTLGDASTCTLGDTSSCTLGVWA